MAKGVRVGGDRVGFSVGVRVGGGGVGLTVEVGDGGGGVGLGQAGSNIAWVGRSSTSAARAITTSCFISISYRGSGNIAGHHMPTLSSSYIKLPSTT